MKLQSVCRMSDEATSTGMVGLAHTISTSDMVYAYMHALARGSPDDQPTAAGVLIIILEY